LVQASTAIGSSIRGILRAHGLRLEASTDSESFGEEAKRVAEQLLEPVRYAIEQLVQSFELLHSQQLQMYKDLGTGQKEDPVVRRLKTIPGIGPATAAAFVATIDDPKRFADGEKVASYIGLVPSVYQSGDTEFRGKITKNGDKLLRWLLVEAAQTLLTRSKTPCELREWGLRIEAKKGLGKARVAVARRLCGLMWKLWVSGDVFHAESLRQAA
jgi:transposase